MDRKHFKVIPAVYLLLRKDDEVLLLKRANTGYQDGNYSLVSGHPDAEERATVATAREAKEEAGITIDPSKLIFVHLANRLGGTSGQERLDIFYEAREWEGEISNKEPDKCDDLSWFPIHNLPDNMLPFVRLVINDVINKVAYSEYDTEPV